MGVSGFLGGPWVSSGFLGFLVRGIPSRFAKDFQTEGRDRSAPSSNRPVSPRSGRARAEAIYTIIHACCVDALVALALLLLVALAPQAIMYACCVHARSALAVPALLLLVVLALLLSSLLLLSLLLRRLQCLSLYRLSRFPFHDSQVYFSMKNRSGGAPGMTFGALWEAPGAQLARKRPPEPSGIDFGRHFGSLFVDY